MAVVQCTLKYCGPATVHIYNEEKKLFDIVKPVESHTVL